MSKVHRQKQKWRPFRTATRNSGYRTAYGLSGSSSLLASAIAPPMIAAVASTPMITAGASSLSFSLAVEARESDSLEAGAATTGVAAIVTIAAAVRSFDNIILLPLRAPVFSSGSPMT